jgi:hypothetical protein
MAVDDSAELASYLEGLGPVALRYHPFESHGPIEDECHSRKVAPEVADARDADVEQSVLTIGLFPHSVHPRKLGNGLKT